MRECLGAAERDRMVSVIVAEAQFAGIEVLALALVAGRFEMLVRVPDRESAGEGMTDGVLVDRVYHRYGARAVKRLENLLAIEEHAPAVRAGLLARMHDLGMFLKVVKQRTTQSFNAQRGRVGTLWDRRFRSVLLESSETGLLGEAADMVVGLPLRLKLCRHPGSYRWCWRRKCMGPGKPRERCRAVEDFLADMGRWCGELERARDFRVVPAAFVLGAIAIGGKHFVAGVCRAAGRGFTEVRGRHRALRSGDRMEVVAKPG